MATPIDEAIGQLTSVCGLLAQSPIPQSFDEAIPLLESARARLEEILNPGGEPADSPSAAPSGLNEPDKLRELDLAVARATTLAGNAASLIAGWELLRRDVPKPLPTLSLEA